MSSKVLLLPLSEQVIWEPEQKTMVLGVLFLSGGLTPAHARRWAVHLACYPLEGRSDCPRQPWAQPLRQGLRHQEACPRASMSAQQRRKPDHRLSNHQLQRHLHSFSEPGLARTAAAKRLGSQAQEVKTVFREDPWKLEAFADFQDSPDAPISSPGSALADRCIRHRCVVALLYPASSLRTFCWGCTGQSGRNKEVQDKY